MQKRIILIEYEKRNMKNDIDEIKPYDEQAIDIVVSVINQAKQKVGIRQNLWELATSRNELSEKWKVSLQSIEPPLAITCEKLIKMTIEKEWGLTPTFQYILRYMGSSQDESSQYYYYEVVFSQPTVSYPIPQATASVFFRVEDKHIEPPEIKGVPGMQFRIEGQYVDHDVRYVLLTVDWILAVIKMKIKFYQRIEAYKLF